jgi:hypothetical protein
MGIHATVFLPCASAERHAAESWGMTTSNRDCIEKILMPLEATMRCCRHVRGVCLAAAHWSTVKEAPFASRFRSRLTEG